MKRASTNIFSPGLIYQLRHCHTICGREELLKAYLHTEASSCLVLLVAAVPGIIGEGVALWRVSARLEGS